MKRVLVYGGKGGLGRAVVSHFKNQGWWVCSVDLTTNDEASANVVVDPAGDWQTQADFVASNVANELKEDKLEAVINVAGGWAGGNAASADLVKNADMMWKQSCWSSVIAASLASKHLNTGGCVVLPGAQPAVGGTPGMMGYGMAKAAVHQLVKSLAGPKSGLPENSSALAILPVTLDTPMNRKWMPKADTSTWTTLEFVAELMMKWADDSTARPANGSLVQLITKGGETSLVCE